VRVGKGRARTGAAVARALGFTFIELIVVMGVLAMLMGLTVGYIKGAGRVNALQMARTQLLDAARRAQGNSRGEKISMFTFRLAERENSQRIHEVFTALADVVLTHAFETIDGASRNLPLKTSGDVRIEPDGRPGSCARFGRGGVLEFEPQASFAVTDGLDVELWIAPEAGPSIMTLIEGQGAYDVALVRGSSGDYDLRLRVNLRPAEGPGEPTWATFESAGGPVKATGLWTHVHVRFDGLQAAFEVNGIDFAKKTVLPGTPGARQGPVSRRIAVPREGAVPLFVGSTAQPFVGRMDALVVRGVFRLVEDRPELPDGIVVEVLEPAKQPLPFRVFYVNGRLDPLRHTTDVRIKFSDVNRPDDAPLILVLGRHGNISADYARGSEAAGASPGASPGGRAPTTPAPSPREPK
jgi:type II secretory pathway pseudopilin PulG